VSAVLPLFAWSETRPVASPRSTPQAANLARVEGGLAPEILRWCRQHVGQEFHMATLTAEVGEGRAPDSVRRILGQLRRAGHVEVKVVQRSASLYRVIAVRHG
jgi:hypothetical protein